MKKKITKTEKKRRLRARIKGLRKRRKSIDRYYQKEIDKYGQRLYKLK